jgi:hypothetical protein
LIPADFITEWREQAPWVQTSQVEQDLIISDLVAEGGKDRPRPTSTPGSHPLGSVFPAPRRVLSASERDRLAIGRLLRTSERDDRAGRVVHGTSQRDDRARRAVCGSSEGEDHA